MAFHGAAKRLSIKLFGFSARQYSSSTCKSASWDSSLWEETPNFGLGILLRRFSTPASDQVNLIKQLRERTSAPIEEVKAALMDSSWNIELTEELRNRGKVLASKKSSRTAAQVLLALAQNESKAAVIELNCETDFVARNEIFQVLMQLQGERPDRHTLSLVLSVCIGLVHLYLGKQIHQLISVLPDVPINNSLITMYSRCGAIIYAHTVFDEMKLYKDVISRNVMIGGYA